MPTGVPPQHHRPLASDPALAALTTTTTHVDKSEPTATTLGDRTGPEKEKQDQVDEQPPRPRRDKDLSQAELDAADGLTSIIRAGSGSPSAENKKSPVDPARDPEPRPEFKKPVLPPISALTSPPTRLAAATGSTLTSPSPFAKPPVPPNAIGPTTTTMSRPSGTATGSASAHAHAHAQAAAAAAAAAAYGYPTAPQPPPPVYYPASSYAHHPAAAAAAAAAMAHPSSLGLNGMAYGSPYVSSPMQMAQGSSGAKRRLSEVESDRRSSRSEDDGGVDRSASKSASARSSRDDKAKRIKTVRACDSCRRKKIRCNPLENAEPPICQHCRQHGFECTWFLPITETRFKRKREQEDQGPEHQGGSSLPPGYGGPSQYPVLSQAVRPAAAPARDSRSPSSSSLVQDGAAPSPDLVLDQAKFTRIYGPTSMSYMMHSTASFPAERMSAFDSKHYQRLTARCTGDGLISVFVDTSNAAPVDDADPSSAAQRQVDEREGYGPDPIRMPNLIGAPGGLAVPGPVAERLLDYFFTNVVHVLPILSRQEFFSATPISPLLFYAICGISALQHDVDPAHRKAVRDVMAGMHQQNDIFTHSDIGTIQSLLLYCLSCELERPRGGTATWTGLGAAVRMGQGLGLHRESIVREEASDHSELRRRLWGTCLIADRWAAAMFGLPMMIDLHDCDRLFPSVHDVRPGEHVDTDARPYSSMVAMIEISILLGRVIKLCYSPTGILHVTDDEAHSLHNDLDAWQDELSDDCKFKGDDSTVSAGLLHLLSVPVRFLLYRPFMRISYQCPENLSFAVGLAEFYKLQVQSAEAIEWVSKHPDVLEHFVHPLYAFFTCCLIQYHAHVRKREARSLEVLKLARTTLYSINVPEMLMRNKVTEIVSLLYTTASTVSKWMDSQRPLRAASATGNADSPSPVPGAIANPTAGAKPRLMDPTLKWHPRPSAPDGGHFETDGDQSVVPGLVLKSASNSPATPQTLGNTGSGTQANTSSIRSTVESGPSDPIHAPVPPPSAYTADFLPVGGAGWFNQAQDGVNVNPTLNVDLAPQANATGAIDFFGSTAFPTDGLDWDWNKLFTSGGLDGFGTGF